MLHDSVAFLICNLLIFTSARAELCITYSQNDPSVPPFSAGVHHCDSSFQKCCGTGCCSTASSDDNLLWFVVLLVIFLIFIYWLHRYCKQYCCSNRRGTSGNVRTNTIFDEDEYIRAASNHDSSGGHNHRPPTIDIDVATNQPETSSTFNSHPITPPPSYDVAVLIPPNPLRPEDKIPSYEDVIKGKLK